MLCDHSVSFFHSFFIIVETEPTTKLLVTKPTMKAKDTTATVTTLVLGHLTHKIEWNVKPCYTLLHSHLCLHVGYMMVSI